MADLTQHDHFLRFKAFKHYAEGGFPQGQRYVDRLNYELGVIAQMNFSPYFLIVGDLCRFMRERQILFNVRGSGCGSLVVWSLGITHKWLDPIKLKLPFERFLNPDRVSQPDLDVDILDERRHEVVAYTIEKYGADRVAHIISFGTLGAKAAINDVCRALRDQLGQDYQEVAKKLTAGVSAQQTLDEAIQSVEFVREMMTAYPQIFAYARRVEGKVRNASVHAAGIVITPDKMTKFMPLCWSKAPDKRAGEDWEPITQWDMYDCETRGHLKMDFLGLRTLRVIKNTVDTLNYLWEAAGANFRLDPCLETIPQDDPKTWDLLRRGDLAGVFQIERHFVREFARQMNLRPGDIWSLAVLISIIRPGMMDCGATQVFLRRKGGQEEPVPLHPLLAETLRENHGLFVFQEDVMWACQDMAGFKMSQADEVRRGIGKKKPEVLAKMKPLFVKGAQERGATPEEIEHVWSQMETFGRYGFCRGHAAAYGVVTCYQTAFLKANYPLAYMTHLINSESGKTDKEEGYNYKVAEYIEEARGMGIKVLPPCVTRSGAMCTLNPRTNEIRFGLGMIKRVGAKATGWILRHARQARSFKDFVLQSYECVQEAQQTPEGPKTIWKPYSRISRSDAEMLIAAGALDVFGLERSKMLAMLGGSDKQPGLRDLAEKYWGQHCKELNGSTRLKTKPQDVMQSILAYNLEDDQVKYVSMEDQLDEERDATGCFLSRSPFEPFHHIIRQYCTTTAGEVLEGEYVPGAVFVGRLTKMTPTIIKQGKNKGREMAFLGFTGVDAAVEMVCFSDGWDRCKASLERHKVYLVSVRPSRDGSPILLDARKLSNQNMGCDTPVPTAA